MKAAAAARTADGAEESATSVDAASKDTAADAVSRSEKTMRMKRAFFDASVRATCGGGAGRGAGASEEGESGGGGGGDVPGG